MAADEICIQNMKPIKANNINDANELDFDGNLMLKVKKVTKLITSLELS